jgi:hypothetical protein
MSIFLVLISLVKALPMHDLDQMLIGHEKDVSLVNHLTMNCVGIMLDALDPWNCRGLDNNGALLAIQKVGLHELGIQWCNFDIKLDTSMLVV